MMAHEIPKHTVPEIPTTAMILGTQKSLKGWKTILCPLKKYGNGALSDDNQDTRIIIVVFFFVK